MQNSVETNIKFLNLIQDAVIGVDRDGMVTFANHMALRLLGLGRDALVSKSVTQKLIIQTESGQSVDVEELLLQPTRDGEKTVVARRNDGERLLIARSDRSQFPASFQTLPYSMTGDDQGMTILFYDASHQEKIEQSKSEFVSLVSHQLRTPVNITSWYTEKLLSRKKGDLNEKQLEYLEEISTSNKRIIDLVSAIVNVSRTDLDRLQSKHEIVELISVMREQVRYFKGLSVRKKVSIETSYGFEEYYLKESDREYITVAMHAILNNALKYNHEDGTIKISISGVSAGQEVDTKSGFVTPGPGAIVAIEDTGLGIPDQQQYQVFLKLFRADNVKALDVTGLGLSLYIARSFIEDLDGHIWFESKLRIGSIFYIYLPAN